VRSVKGDQRRGPMREGKKARVNRHRKRGRWYEVALVLVFGIWGWWAGDGSFGRVKSTSYLAGFPQ
jgi:hypothetical protein